MPNEIIVTNETKKSICDQLKSHHLDAGKALEKTNQVINSHAFQGLLKTAQKTFLDSHGYMKTHHATIGALLDFLVTSLIGDEEPTQDQYPVKDSNKNDTN